MADSLWCLVGNIASDYKPDPQEGSPLSGTRHFASGTKLYCLPGIWGDGYRNIKAIGRHRGSRRLVTMVVRSQWITNWRAQRVYNPELLRLMRDMPQTWTSEAHVKEYLAFLTLPHD